MTANASSSLREHPQSSRRQRPSHFRSGLLLILIGILLAACAPAQPSDPVSIVQAAYDRLNQDDIDGYMEFLSDDAVMIDRTGRIDGAQAIRENLALNFVPVQFRYELSDFSSDGNVVTYTIKIYEDDTLVATYEDGLTIVVDGKIIFDGQDRYRGIECNLDPSQAFCPGN